MAKKYPGQEIQREPPEEGWGQIIFIDSLKAQVAGAKEFKKDGVELIEFYLMPFDSTAKRFGIDLKKDLDNRGYCYKVYPKEVIINLNEYDPGRRFYLSFLNWAGKKSGASDKILGLAQAEDIIRLKRKIRELMAHNEELKNENFIIKHNEKKHIKDTMDGVINPLMPFIKGLLESEAKKEES